MVELLWLVVVAPVAVMAGTLGLEKLERNLLEDPAARPRRASTHLGARRPPPPAANLSSAEHGGSLAIDPPAPGRSLGEVSAPTHQETRVAAPR